MDYRKDIESIVFFDLETTGVDVNNDRIVQIGVIKTDLDFNVLSEPYSILVNPGVPIPAESTDIHGITDQQVATAPTFATIAEGVYKFIADNHIAGYNVRFDIQVLMSEFHRLGIKWDISGLMIVDPMVTLRVMEPRDQSSVYKYYTGKTLDCAHDAKADITATLEIARAQIEKYDTVSTAEDMWRLSEPENMCDLAGKFKMKDGTPVFTFGKHMGEPIANHIGFLQWMLSKDFPQNTKDWINEFLNSYEQ